MERLCTAVSEKTIDIPTLDEISKSLDGKLLRRQEIPLDTNTINRLLENQFIQAKPSIRKTPLTNQCMRCDNRDKLYFAKIPCACCNKTHLYCRKCIQMGRIMECEPLYFWNGPKVKWLVHEDPCSWEGELTTAQKTASDQIKRAIMERKQDFLVWAVTGAGKTEMLFSGVSFALKMGMRICIATPRSDVVRELKPRFEQAFETVSIEAVYGGSEDKKANAQLMLATTHQMLRFQEAFDIIIIDEIDAFPFHADSSLQYATNRAKKNSSTVIYLTATPRKQQQVQIKNGKLAHVFVPTRYHGYPLPVPKLKMTYSLVKELKQYNAPRTFLSWLSKRENPQRQILIFVPTIILAQKLKSSLTQQLLEKNIINTQTELEAVHSEDPMREEKVMAFRNKKLKVIITTTILERGVTFPSVDVAILDAGHVVFDEAALVQIAGRAGRSGADPTGEVIFFHDGKTEAMLQAKHSIRVMNKRGGFN